MITNIFLLLIVISIFYLFFQLKKIELKYTNKKSEIKEDDIILPKLKSMPTIDKIDENSNLLKDIIETAKLEEWNTSIIETFEFSRTVYEFKINSNNNRVYLNCRLRVNYEGLIRPWIGNLNITIENEQQFDTRVSYNIEEESPNYKIVLEFLWSLLIIKNNSEFQERTESYKKDIEKISKELKLLNRSRKIDLLF